MGEKGEGGGGCVVEWYVLVLVVVRTARHDEDRHSVRATAAAEGDIAFGFGVGRYSKVKEVVMFQLAKMQSRLVWVCGSPETTLQLCSPDGAIRNRFRGAPSRFSGGERSPMLPHYALNALHATCN